MIALRVACVAADKRQEFLYVFVRAVKDKEIPGPDRQIRGRGRDGRYALPP